MPHTTERAVRNTSRRAALFPLGSTSVSPAALAALAEAGTFADDLFLRHQTGDFGSREHDEQQAAAVRNGWRVFSEYSLCTGSTVMVVTEGARDRTECLLPEEFFSPPSHQPPAGAFTVVRWKSGRFWAVYAPDGGLVSVCVYRKGAATVAGLLSSATPFSGSADHAR